MYTILLCIFIIYVFLSTEKRKFRKRGSEKLFMIKNIYYDYILCPVFCSILNEKLIYIFNTTFDINQSVSSFKMHIPLELISISFQIKNFRSRT